MLSLLAMQGQNRLKARSHFEYAPMFSELGQTLRSAMTSSTSNCVLPCMRTLNRDTALVCTNDWGLLMFCDDWVEVDKS